MLYLDLLAHRAGEQSSLNLAGGARSSRFWTATLYPGSVIWSWSIPQLSSNKHETWPIELTSTCYPTMETGKLDCFVYWCIYIRLSVKVYVFVGHNNSSRKEQCRLSISLEKNHASTTLDTFSLVLISWTSPVQCCIGHRRLIIFWSLQ